MSDFSECDSTTYNNMKEYIRTTHEFDNQTREWINRDLKSWKTLEFKNNFPKVKWNGYGIHGVERDHWKTLEQITHDYIEMTRRGWVGTINISQSLKDELNQFIKTEFNFFNIIMADLEKEYDYLAEYGLVQLRPNKKNKIQESKFCQIAQSKLKQFADEERAIYTYIQYNMDVPWSVPYNYSDSYRDDMFISEEQSELYWQSQTDFQ